MTVLKAVSNNEVEIKKCEYHFGLWFINTSKFYSCYIPSEV